MQLTFLPTPFPSFFPADEVPELLNADFGEPEGLCSETAPKSGIFTRKWTKADVAMDCNTWTPTITLH